MEQDSTPKNIRNFAIVAHIDHGKSTLADRLLEITETVSKNQMKEQFLDQNPISRERGITIKLAPVRMNYTLNAINYTLNLIDTPGHIDFSYEVSRTLACCEGVILLIDATQGIQAQTVAHFNTATSLGLSIVPVINKIDMDIARVEETENQMVELFGLKKEEILKISAKTGQGVAELLNEIVKKIPSPTSSQENVFRALIFDAVYDDHRGVISFVRVFDGTIKKQDRIEFFQSDGKPIVSEVGIFTPFLSAKENLSAGEIGYIVTGIKDIRQAKVGDTITISQPKASSQRADGSFGPGRPLAEKVEPLPGYKNPIPMVFFGVYPKSPNDFVRLKEALNKLSLNDASLTIELEYSSFLGSGFRVGFLGLLHAEIVKERLKQESGVEPLLTRPQVLYKKNGDKTLEPYMKLTIYTPKDYVGPLMNLCEKKRGTLINIIYKDRNAIIYYDMPYSCLLANLTSSIKSISSGFASIDYEITGYKDADLVNLEIFVNDVPIDVLSETVYKDEANFVAREKTEKLKELLPRQQYRQIIQARLQSPGSTATGGRAKVIGKILARCEISPFRKDVLAKMSGGDRTRKDKLLKKQKKGKERMQSQAKIDIPQEALFSLIGS